MAKALYARSVRRTPDRRSRRSLVEWAALLHEIGYTVSHIGFHKHGAYILANADMPGFSAQEQRQLAMLVLGCRGGLSKMASLLADADMRAQVLALRLAVLLPSCARPHRCAADPRSSRHRDRRSAGANLGAMAEGAPTLTLHLLRRRARGSGARSATRGRTRPKLTTDPTRTSFAAPEGAQRSPWASRFGPAGET